MHVERVQWMHVVPIIHIQGQPSQSWSNEHTVPSTLEKFLIRFLEPEYEEKVLKIWKLSPQRWNICIILLLIWPTVKKVSFWHICKMSNKRKWLNFRSVRYLQNFLSELTWQGRQVSSWDNWRQSCLQDILCMFLKSTRTQLARMRLGSGPENPYFKEVPWNRLIHLVCHTIQVYTRGAKDKIKQAQRATSYISWTSSIKCFDNKWELGLEKRRRCVFTQTENEFSQTQYIYSTVPRSA